MQRRDHYRLLSSSEIVYHVLMSALIIYHLWLYLYSYLLASHSVVGGAGRGGVIFSPSFICLLYYIAVLRVGSLWRWPGV